ncbi:prolipoprotein diacylglyceryl transferase [Porphyromonas gingivicanis]|uniref:Phosphatidylglycerol--prolipoprotein diacylglyceryl transferase n=1 Tax=Porphyromonas gingivicanis TaxID=266762 RepID=A0A0A2G551_9PORP|nr:prolipoprotein diacylglyceryl transferase [Porphyromonas gingivicanis]KGN97602.1 prolipoprotein diacylglyceryl transferase [Porphyromonas gingivicanis]
MSSILNTILWDVDPALFSFLGREVRWYGLLFGLGLFFLGPWIVARIWKKEQLPQNWYDKLFWYVVLGTVLGARLGHCFFYEPLYYLANPVEIFKVWEGGLASHGGTLGIIIAIWIYSRKVSHKPMIWTLDRLAVPVGLVAALIRIGNLMNSEIFGRPTTLPWGFQFMRSPEYLSLNTSLGCHPTAIYEALAYLVVFGVCMWLYWKKDAALHRPGLIVGFFLFGTFIARLIIESVKLVQEPWETDMVQAIGLNQGQLLSIPFIAAGLYLIIRALRRPQEV